MGNAGPTADETGLTLIWTRKVVSFLCVCALVYALLMGLWLIWGAVYSRFYSAGANHLFGSFGARAVVYFSPSRDAGDEVKIAFYDRQRVDGHSRPIPLLRIAHDVHYGVYIYVAFMIALIVATPIPRRRRAWGAVLGTDRDPCIHGVQTHPSDCAVTQQRAGSSPRIELVLEAGAPPECSGFHGQHSPELHRCHLHLGPSFISPRGLARDHQAAGCSREDLRWDLPASPVDLCRCKGL